MANRYFMLGLLLCLSVPALIGQHHLIQMAPQERNWYDNQLAADTSFIHTAIQPWRRSDVAEYDRKQELLPDSLLRTKGFFNWVNRKLFYENFLRFQGDNYDLTINPVMAFQYGQDAGADYDFTYQNTRGARIELALGEKVSAYSTLVETQARLPFHVNQLTDSIGVVPGYWRAKDFREQAFDFAYAAGEVAYTPNETFHFRLGHGKQFIGEGYRSMLMSDNAVNYPFFRIETQFGRLKYVNTWAILNDIRPEVSIEDVFAKKYLSMHYLSVFIGQRLNLGLFEGIMWGDELNRYGFDPNFLNPVILYRPVEFAQGSTGGNVMMGLNLSYRLFSGLKAYGQIALDDFKLSELQRWNEGSWLNLYAWQLGVKYGDALGIKNLFLQAEYNAARPYMYSHREVLTNWGHYNQPLAHPWGGNFEEVLLRVNYRAKRWLAEAAIHVGQAGRDVDSLNYGGNIYQSYNTRATNNDVFIGNGVVSDISYWIARLSYLFNPVYNLRLEVGYQSRTEVGKAKTLPDSRHFFFGLRTNMYQMYHDY